MSDQPQIGRATWVERNRSAKPMATDRRFAIACVCLAACRSRAPLPAPPPTVPHDATVAEVAIDALVADPNWKIRYDFDGDHVPDAIDVSFSGGAHCCYTLAIGLSRDRRVVQIPFQLDGGYLGGLDLSRPESFAIETGADGVASLRMRIASYGAQADPIPLEWVRTYGIRSHVIRVGLRDSKLHVENIEWDCETALARIAKLQIADWEGLPACDEPALAEHLESRIGLERELGSAHRLLSTRRAFDAYAAKEITLVVDKTLVRVDVDLERPTATMVENFGPPEARLPYTLWGFKHATGQWVWSARGIVAYVDPTNRTVHHVGLFAPTDLETYRRDLAWP